MKKKMWTIHEYAGDFTLGPCTKSEAIDQLIAELRTGDEEETIFWNIAMTSEDGDEFEEFITIDPVEPPCEGGSHDWQEDDVVGHGGGVICTEVCTKCDMRRITDTWAQASGRQGLTSIKYVREKLC